MKRFGNLLMSAVFVATTVGASAAQAQEGKNATLAKVQVQLQNDKVQLEELAKSLRSAKMARAGWVTATVVLGGVSVLTAIPGVMMLAGGTAAKLRGERFLGDPDNGGVLMVPVVIFTTVVSAGTGYGAYKTYQQMELRASDVKILLEKIEAKKIEITEAEEALKTINN